MDLGCPLASDSQLCIRSRFPELKFLGVASVITEPRYDVRELIKFYPRRSVVERTPRNVARGMHVVNEPLKW